MIQQAEQLASNQEVSIIEAAKARMHKLQESELQRLQALSEVNPNIRQEEIDHLAAETDELQHHLASAQLKLEAVRLAVTTE
jgi:ATP-dependent helicase HepA